MFVILFTLLLGAPVHAAMPWEVQSVTIEQTADELSIRGAVENDCDSAGTFLFEEIGWDQIVNVGQKVWEIVEAGKPVVTVETPVAHALPRGLKCWADLEHWQAPRTQSYQVVYRNGFGMEVVKFRFRLHYTYGGGHAELGRYLANVSVQPAELNVMWGYNFDATVEALTAVNLGSKADPLAGLEVNVKWTVKTPFQENRNVFHVFVQGDGVAQVAR